MSDYRIEEDTLGPVKIPVKALWGPQTERSRHNFITGPIMPTSVIRALLAIKSAAAKVNLNLGVLDKDKAELIQESVASILKLDDPELMNDFPLHVYQTGSGTQTNMNVNEVISNVAMRIDKKIEISPNDDVNHSQSSNDVFPTAMNVAAVQAVEKMLPVVESIISELEIKQDKYWDVVKIGRTHLQDATPLTFGQEISGWISILKHDRDYLQTISDTLLELPIGVTAVGTGLNAPEGFDEKMVSELSDKYQQKFVVGNKFYGLSAHSGLVITHSAIKTLAGDLLKIANDIRFLASGPRAGYDELNIPANEPGSSIMPGKVNPTQAEALTMAAVKVMGNDVTVSTAASQGNFEMNVYKPVIIETFLESCDVLTGTLEMFTEKLIKGLTVNQGRMTELVDNSLMTVTALSPHIGYHKAAEIAQLADKENSTLKAAAMKLGYLSEEDFDKYLVPINMTNINKQKD
ncbi:class II fumarate hydratase [Companilactobacillus mishanensis]|uniref:Fumarate hydratase class II n=1 Tax=Companilactobacillus mishanensis TaxID=2486008 RepID=A0ABW9P8B9_9LACO|nr:class II fumarate hydratase [Companilactobacillus mishanensis]MQS45460.1 class II fumarate hydratase [Companilactobacillus mishanensis]